MLANSRRHVVILFLLILSGFAQAEAVLELVPDKSTLKYSAYKYRTMLVEGLLKPEAIPGFSGTISGDPGGLAEQMTGTLILEKPSFDSENAARDEAIDQLFKTKIVISLLAYDSKNSPKSLGLKLSLNNAEQTVHTDPQLAEEEGLLRVRGDLTLDRRDFNLIFTEGFAGTLDVAVSNEFTVHYDLKFKGNAEARTYIRSLPGEGREGQETASWPGLLEWTKAKLQELFGRP